MTHQPLAFTGSHRAAFLAQLALHTPQQMRHRQWLAAASRDEDRGQDRVLDLRARQLDVRCEHFDGRFESLQRLVPAQLPDHLAPDPSPFGRIGPWKLEHVPHPTNERGIDVLLLVGREDDDAAVFFEQLKQVTGVGVGVAVVGIFHFGALAEDRFSLI